MVRKGPTQFYNSEKTVIGNIQYCSRSPCIPPVRRGNELHKRRNEKHLWALVLHRAVPKLPRRFGIKIHARAAMGDRKEENQTTRCSAKVQCHGHHLTEPSGTSFLLFLWLFSGSASLLFLDLPAFPQWRHPKIPPFKPSFSKSDPLYRCLFHIKSSLGLFSLRVPPEWAMMFNWRAVTILQILSPLLIPSVIYWNQVASCESKGAFVFNVPWGAVLLTAGCWQVESRTGWAQSHCWGWGRWECSDCPSGLRNRHQEAAVIYQWCRAWFEQVAGLVTRF